MGTDQGNRDKDLNCGEMGGWQRGGMEQVILDAATFGFPRHEWESLEQFGALSIFDHTPYDSASIIERCVGCEVVYTNKVPFTRETLKAISESTRLIGVLATGYNIIDVEAAREFGIAVCNAPAYGPGSVAQHAVALMLELTNNVGLHNQWVQDGKWIGHSSFTHWERELVELADMTVGLVGFGDIGRRVGQIVSAFGATVMAAVRTPKDAPGWAGFRWASIEEVFAEADIVSLHCPQTAETTGLVNAARLKAMKRSAFLINTGRGGLVDEDALRSGLESGEIAGAALDVVAVEPMAADNPLLGAPNCIITPHQAWSSVKARRNLIRITAANVDGFLRGEAQNLVT